MDIKDIKAKNELTMEFMMQYIDENKPSFKDEFKKKALKKNKNGDVRYNSAAAKQAFCLEFLPHLLPKKKEKKTKTQLFEEW